MPDGWHYLDGKVRIDTEDGTHEGLLRAVERYLISNNKPTQGYVDMVNEQICRLHPQMCQGETLAFQGTKDSRVRTFVDDIIAWALRMRSNPAAQRMEEQSEAERRGSICAQCPQQKKWRHLCPNCVSEADQLLALIRNGRNVSMHRKLEGCAHYGHCNRTAVFLDKSTLAKDAPEGCWAR